MTSSRTTQLTAAEIGTLWYQYMSDSMAFQMLMVFSLQVEDIEIRSVIEYAKELSQKHLVKISEMLSGESVPLPTGFTENDINPAAPRLFSDPFYLSYVRNMARVGIQRYGLALTSSAREDIRKFLHQCIRESAELDEKATRLELSKGLYVRSPYIPASKQQELVENNDFMGSIFGEQRPLLAMEIDHLFVNAQSNMMGKALFIGFSQIAQTPEIRDYILRGKQIAHKQMEVLSATLIKEDLPAPMSLDSYITASTTPAFSDKLMLYHSSMLQAAGLGNYGVSISMSMRIDIAITYARFMLEVGQYIEDGAHIMIKNGWMEKPPQALDRKALVLSR